MKKPFIATVFLFFLTLGITSCSGDAPQEENESANNTEVSVEQEQEETEPEVVEPESTSENFSELVGDWTIDAATAGIQMDLSFGEDGSFSQKMGAVNGEGTWEVVDEEHIKIVTQNTTGQTWKVTDLTETTVNICWNPEAAKPKTLPMERVK